MGEQPDPDLLAKGIRSLAKEIHTCYEIMKALVETNQRLVRDSWFAIVQTKTDYERSRKRMLGGIRSLIERLKLLESDEWRPDVIRATAHLRRIADCCRKCPETNLKNLAEGRRATCLAASLVKLTPSSRFRFRLNEKGQIIGSSEREAALRPH